MLLPCKSKEKQKTEKNVNKGGIPTLFDASYLFSFYTQSFFCFESRFVILSLSPYIYTCVSPSDVCIGDPHVCA